MAGQGGIPNGVSDRMIAMIKGVVNSRREAILRLKVRGPGGIDVDVDAVIDTGFTASLSLPSASVDALGLVQKSKSSAILADGSVRKFAIYNAEVKWDGTWRTVLVSAIGDEPLLGMRLLEGHELRIEVKPSGLVQIVPLP